MGYVFGFWTGVAALKEEICCESVHGHVVAGHRMPSLGGKTQTF